MPKLYSPSARGFFDRAVHGESVPKDAVEITDEQWRQLLVDNAKGLDIVAGEGGKPASCQRVIPEAEARANLTAQRDALLRSTDGLVARHRDEVEAGSQTTFTTGQYKQLQAYRAALRAVPAQKDFPSCGLPSAPDFLKSAK